MIEDWQSGGFGLYIHWPFCEAKCPYCDFNSFVSRSIDQSEWRTAYLAELARVAEQTAGRTLNSVYFGGGTPSLMAPETVDSILGAIASHWHMSNDIEITLEANPGSVEAGRFHAFREAGINRVSLGIQALNDSHLRALGRIHSVAEALQALETAKNAFDRVSFDLIYARQNQSLSEWEQELKQALSFGTDHLSLYQLTIEPGTAFGDRYKAGKLRGLPDDNLGADMFAVTQELCNAHGFPAYEVSNHARPGQGSRHNQIYWRYGDYLGIGPGAHGRVTVNGQKFATETHLNPTTWLNSVKNGSGQSMIEAIDPLAQHEEYLMMSLRMTEGVDLERLNRLSGRALDAQKVQDLVELGLLEQNGQSLSTTAAGRPILNAILQKLLVD